jgi:hypothetical protein
MLKFKGIAVMAGLLITIAILLPGCNLIITGGCEIKPEAQCSGADLHGANLTNADLTGARYDTDTKWPKGFDPDSIGWALLAAERS